MLVKPRKDKAQRKKYTPAAVEDINKRLEALAQIQADYIDKKEKLTYKIMLAQLEKKGFKPSHSTLQRDLLELSKGNNYVRNIAEFTFSQQIEEIANTLDACEQLSWQWLKNPPIITKRKYEPTGATDKDGKQQLRMIEQSEESMNPRQIIQDIVTIAQAKKDLLTGDVLNVSVVLLGNKLQHQQDELKRLQEKEQPQAKPLALIAVEPEVQS